MQYCKIFFRPKFRESSRMGSIFCDTPATVWPQILQYPQLPPPSCSGHLQFQYSTSNAQPSWRFWGLLTNLSKKLSMFNLDPVSNPAFQLSSMAFKQIFQLLWFFSGWLAAYATILAFVLRKIVWQQCNFRTFKHLTNSRLASILMGSVQNPSSVNFVLDNHTSHPFAVNFLAMWVGGLGSFVSLDPVNDHGFSQ